VGGGYHAHWSVVHTYKVTNLQQRITVDVGGYLVIAVGPVLDNPVTQVLCGSFGLNPSGVNVHADFSPRPDGLRVVNRVNLFFLLLNGAPNNVEVLVPIDGNIFTI
jgi:hypothetical protein